MSEYATGADFEMIIAEFERIGNMLRREGCCTPVTIFLERKDELANNIALTWDGFDFKIGTSAGDNWAPRLATPNRLFIAAHGVARLVETARKFKSAAADAQSAINALRKIQSSTE